MATGFSPRFCRKCLYSSLSPDDMIRFARMAYPDYDIYATSGFPRGYPIPGQDAANQIVYDMIKAGYFIDFVELLIRIDKIGHMGRKYPLRGLDIVIDDIIQAGYSFDGITGQFFEDQNQQVTSNWGRLLENDERQMAVLRLDIAGNTVLVKENPKELIDKAYGDIRSIVTEAVVSRLGRLWSWEGDGALGVFMLGDYSRMAIFAGMDIINRMYLFNKIDNPLNSNVNLRLAIHSGSVVYSENELKYSKADVIKIAKTLEAKAAIPNSLVISDGVARSQDQSLLNIFSDTKVVPNTEKYRIYQVSCLDCPKTKGKKAK